MTFPVVEVSQISYFLILQLFSELYLKTAEHLLLERSTKTCIKLSKGGDNKNFIEIIKKKSNGFRKCGSEL